MPTPTYLAIANTTLSSTAASVTFSGITQSYRDLVLIISGRTTSTTGNNNCYVSFNSDTTNNYSMLRMTGDGSNPQTDTVGSTSIAGWAFIENSSTSNFTPVIYNIMDYSATDKHKTVLGRGNGASNFVTATVSRWASTAAITSMQVTQSGSAWASGSSFALYGVIA